MFLPFIDHVIGHLESRFPERLKPMYYGFYVLPSLIHKLSNEIIESIKVEYESDLPYTKNLFQEGTQRKCQ